MTTPIFEGREDPIPSTAAETKAGWLRAAEGWLRPSQLADGHHVRSLLARRDWVSTAELFVIGHAVEKMKSRSTDDLRSLSRRATLPSPGDSIGAVFELTMAALFDGPTHPVALSPQNAKGYDLAVTLPNGKMLRASCKARVPSEHEARFRSFVQALERGAARRLPPGSATFIHVRCDQRPSDDATYVAAHVEAIMSQHRSWRRKELVEFAVPCGRATIKPLVAPGQQTFWPHAPSYNLVSGLSLGQNEQVRFRDRLKEALEKFKLHCADVTADTGNVVLLKIPTAIRIDEARALAQETLATADGALVSAVYVYRTQVAADPGGQAFYLCHELHEIENPSATHPIRSYLPDGFTFVISPIVGRAQNVEPILTLKLDDGEMQLTETHLEIRGHLHYLADVRKGGSVAFGRPPNTAVTYVLRKKGRHERLDYPAWPTDLVLI